MQKMIPLSVPNLKGNEQKYVCEAIESQWVSTAGAFVNRFEQEMASYLNVKEAVACQSGTAGLHLALLALGINSNHEVIVPTLTFIAAVNPVKYVGAEPIFFDCDASLCLDPLKLEKFCEEECCFKEEELINKKSGKPIKAIIVVHIFGNMADLGKICDVAKKYKLLVIEDATEALGTCYVEEKYENKFAGTIGDVGVYSFNGNKIITTGGGGMVVAKDHKVLEKIKYLSTQAKDDEISFIHNEVGYNYRMTNIQAAMGVAQLEQLEDFIKVKKDNYNLYKNEIQKIDGLTILDFKENIRPNYWFYTLYFESEYVLNKDQIIKYLGSKMIQVRPIWGLVGDQKPYIGKQTYRIEKARGYFEKAINIPCSSNLSREDAMYIIDCLKQPLMF